MTADTHPRESLAPGLDPPRGPATSHEGVARFVAETAALTKPDRIHWVTGSAEEWTELTEALVATGTFTRLNPAIKPNSFYAASDPTDVARVEDRTYICSVDEKDCGPTNNWMDPQEMKDPDAGLYDGCMRGRTMYVVPFVMGHLEAEKPMFGVELTDSAYVVVSMLVMARTGTARAAPPGGARRAGPCSGSRPCTRSGCRSSRARPTWRGRATRPSTSCSSPRSGRSGRSGPATAATRCWARSATRCASPA